MLYKVGDKVKIKKREELEKCGIVVEAMLPYAEQIATITHVDDWYGFYHIDDKEFNHYRWDDECFCGRGLPDLPKEFDILETFDKEISLLDILYNRIDKLEKRVEELERKVSVVETLTMR